MAVEATVSQKIRNLGFVCALLVVATHVSWAHDGLGPSWAVWNLVDQGVSRIAVPFFFCVSGYMLAGHFGTAGWFGNEVAKRVRSLLVPFLVWSLAGALLALPDASFGAIFGEGRWLAALGLDLRVGPTWNYALWYVRALFLLVLVSPVLGLLVRRFGRAWLVASFVLNLLIDVNDCLPFRRTLCYGLALGGVFYFSLGIWLRTTGRLGTVRRGAWVCGIVSGLILVSQMIWYAVRPSELAAYRFYPLAVPFMLYAAWHVIPSRVWPAGLTAMSFPIYVIHVPILRQVSMVLEKVPAVAPCADFVLWTSAVALSIALIVLLRRVLPRVSAGLFAGRV